MAGNSLSRIRHRSLIGSAPGGYWGAFGVPLDRALSADGGWVRFPRLHWQHSAAYLGIVGNAQKQWCRGFWERVKWALDITK